MTAPSTNDIELRRIQDMAVGHAIGEMDAAGGLTLETKEERGNRHWLTGMATRSMNVAIKIEQFMILRDDHKGQSDDDFGAEAAKASLVKSARAEVASIMERVGAGPKLD